MYFVTAGGVRWFVTVVTSVADGGTEGEHLVRGRAGAGAPLRVEPGERRPRERVLRRPVDPHALGADLLHVLRRHVHAEGDVPDAGERAVLVGAHAAVRRRLLVLVRARVG